MRDHEEDSKKPQPIRSPKKRSHAPEAAEAAPWSPAWSDLDLDRHRHI